MLADDIGVTGGYNIYSDMANTSYVTYFLHSVPRQAQIVPLIVPIVSEFHHLNS